MWVEAVPPRHQIKPPPHLFCFTVFYCAFISHLSLPCPSVSDHCRGPDAGIRGSVSVTKAESKLIPTHLHYNNSIWSISDCVLHASTEVITPDKMLSLLVYHIKKKKRRMEFHFLGFWLKINLRDHKYVKSHFLSPWTCVNMNLPYPSIRHLSFQHHVSLSEPSVQTALSLRWTYLEKVKLN